MSAASAISEQTAPSAPISGPITGAPASRRDGELRFGDLLMPHAPAATPPLVRPVSYADIGTALARGLADFRAMPTHVAFLAIVYPVVGLLLSRFFLGVDLVALIYPAAAGFALVAPLVAIGLYELSRRREMGLDTSWRHAFDVMASPSLPAILTVAGLLVVVFLAWMAIANGIYVANIGHRSVGSLDEFARLLLTTPGGHQVILWGNIAGFAFAAFVFALVVVTFPLLLDRQVGPATAMATSLRVVAASPGPMALWAAIIAAGLVAGSLPALLGLAVVLPVLAHASWHIYRLAVVPDARPRPLYVRPRRMKRHGAQFPYSLFAPSSRDLEDA
ncbi:MAG: DUF2189 domain-containing protein [Hyphomicrobiaceae bacterium]|nr:DUF2189 domain-containing protein [Hyphomicrobiaceae bacterium]